MKGNVALTTVLVFTALFIATAIVVVYQALDIADSSSSYTNQIYAQNMSITCLEEALYKVSNNPLIGRSQNAESSFTMNFSKDGKKVKSCSVNITTPENSQDSRVIAIQSKYHNTSYDLTRTIVDVTLDNWQIN